MLKRNIAANVISQGWTALMGLAFIPVYLSHMGAEAYGLIGIFAVMQAWLGLLDMGMTPTINREMARFGAGQHSTQSIRDLLRSLELVCLCAAVMLASGFALSSTWLASHWLQVEALPTTVVAHALAAIGVVVALRLVEGLFRGALLGRERQVWLGAATAVLASLRWGGAAVVVQWVDNSIATFFVWHALVSLAGTGWLALGTYRTLPPSRRAARFDLAQLRSVYQFAGGMALSMLLAVLLTQLDKILLSSLLSLSQLGHYTLAGTVAGGLYQVTAPLFQAFYPRMTSLVAAGDDVALRRCYHLGAQLVGVTAFPTALLMVFFADPLLQLWTRDPSASSTIAPLLRVLAVGTLLNCLMNMPMALLLAHGRPSFIVRTNGIAVALLVPAIVVVTPRFGAIGAAWIWLLLNVGYVLVAVHFLHRRLLPREKWLWYRSSVVTPLLASTLVVAACATSGTVNAFNGWSWLAFGLIAALAYGCTAFATPMTRSYLVNWLRNRFGVVPAA